MFTKIYRRIENLWRQPSARNQETNEGYLPFFNDGDNFTLKWAKLISESPSATACLSTLTDFLEGFGFNQADLEKLVVNAKGETLWQTHSKTCAEFGQNSGFYWLFRYNALGVPTEWEVLSFENCRLGKPDDNGYINKIHYNPFFGTPEYRTQDKNQTKIYDCFNPRAVKQQMIDQGNKFKGQILFIGTTTTLSRFYPIPEPFSAHKWNGTEAGIADYHEDNVNNGLLQPYILVMRGDPSAPSTNPEYTNQQSDRPITVGEEFDEVMSKNFMGAKRVGNQWVQWVGIGEEAPFVVPLPSNANGDLFITLDNQSTKKITVAWKVPGILANIQEGTSLGGDANQVRVAVKLMQQRVIKRQRLLTDAYTMILSLMDPKYKNIDLSIVPYNPYPELEVLDDKIWNALTAEEKRQWIQDNTEIDLEDGQEIESPSQETPVPESKYLNRIPVGFPDKIRNNVKKALDYMDKMEIKCGGKTGRSVSEDIVNNASMGVRQIKRIHSYLKKNERHANSPYNEGCEVILYNAWGGKEMFDFLDSKLKEVESWLN